MSLRLFSETTFIEAKKKVFFPSRAITSPENLVGRISQLDKIRRAFSNDGKQIFVFGERGVGKTSLAKTAAYLYQSIDAEPVLVACSPNSTFSSILQDVARGCLPADETMRKVVDTKHRSLGVKGIGHQAITTIEKGDVPKIENVNHAIAILKFVSQLHSDSPVVIIDEFDRILSEEERGLFADFLKQVSDQELNTKFIFCGISTDVDGLIGQHFSAGRYMSPIELGPLSQDALWEIFEKAEETFGVSIDREIKIRAAIIADGYPYFMHLIGDSLLWNMFQNQLDAATPDLFEKAIRQAVDEAEPMLKQHYDNATQKYESKDYSEVLWSVAATRVFPKKWKEIYENYYLELINPLALTPNLTSDAFYKRILNLTKKMHGEILKTNENGWYQFRENVVRSYVRLRAAEAGIELGPDLPGQLKDVG
jgi:hypothetical protein